jgi:hypothetical protein
MEETEKMIKYKGIAKVFTSRYMGGEDMRRVTNDFEIIESEEGI